MNRTTSSARLSSPTRHFTLFGQMPTEVQAQVVEHAASDPSKALTVEDAWATARRNANLCSVSKRFRERAQPFVHLSHLYTLALMDGEQPASTKSLSLKRDLITTDPRILYQRLEAMPFRLRSLTPVQRLQVFVDAHMGMATEQDVKACFRALTNLGTTAAAIPTAQLPTRTIPTLIALFLCRSLTNLRDGTAWHLSAVHLLMNELRDVPDDIAVPALLQIAVITMMFERLGHPFIRLRAGSSQMTLSTNMLLSDLQQRAAHRNDQKTGLRSVATVLASTPQAPADANTITIALNCLETLDHPLIGVWAATLNKLENLDLPRESRERLDRCVQKAKQNGWASGSAPPGQLLIARV